MKRNRIPGFFRHTIATGVWRDGVCAQCAPRRANMEMDYNNEPLDWDDDLDESNLDDEFDAIAEFEAETSLGPEALQALGLSR